MNKTVKFDWFIIFLSCMCNFKSVCSEESVPVHYKGKYTSDIKNYEIVVPQRVNKDGSFISHLVSHHHSKRSTKELDFIFYKIPIGGKDYLIELTPNRKLISPGAVVEIHRKDVRKSANRKFSNQTINNEKVTKMFRNLDIKKMENTDCHFSGHVKGENTSKAALSTCYGLAGFIQIHKGFYTIEPVAEHNPFLEDAYPHILYKTDGFDNSSVCHTMGEFSASVVDGLFRKRRESSIGSSTPIYIETLIVMDKTFIKYYEDSDCENYVLTVFNMAFNLFRDVSSGLMMTLTLVRLIRLEIENDDMNLKVNEDAEESLRHFQTWQYQINPGDDSHPNHHDIALLVTKVDVCYSTSTCGLLGLTTIGKGCDPKLSAALCEDKGLRLGYVIAHVIGHLLGAGHDYINSTCNGTDANGLKTVMHPHISTTTQTWSTCSQAYFKEFFSSGKGNCFLDEPEEHHFNVHDLLPGVMYNADFQCKHLITAGARECAMGSTCDSLNCYVPGYACIITHVPPADGTHCGENMWCHEDKCLVIGERPGAVDGNWGEWSAWSDCSRSCGSGVASSTRNCDKPQPSHGGKNCVGERKRYKICASTPCQTGRPSFRDIQCGEFDDWIYPEDGKIHSWKSYFFNDDNPCVLYCINEEKQVVALKPRVVDGTMCFRGIRDICVSGVCKSLPCDLQFDSNAVEDACGVCHGDGTNCEFSEGKETFSKLTKGLTKLVNVPSGSRNIKVEETSPTLARIVVRDKDTKEIYVRGKSLGMFSVPGSQAWLGMIKKNQEALHIPGPVTKPLSIWIQRLENVTVKWSIALPAEQQRKPEFAWDFLKWGPCSAVCGPGIQKSEPSCMEEKAGLVEDTFCADLEMPVPKVRQCEVTKCQSRWMVGDWKGCDSEKKERKRVVYCITPIGEHEGESQIVSDSKCVGPKPHDKEPCENRQKREDTEYNFEENFIEPDTAQFKDDTSEFGFHKKYEVYLKHFAALSVPQRNSETIPFHLVSSPHFKHYFHVLETPADPETETVPDFDTRLPNVTSYDMGSQSKVSPKFLTETFSGQRIGVTHVHALPQESTYSPEHRRKKNLDPDFTPKLRVKFKRRPKKASQTSKTTPNINLNRWQHPKRRLDRKSRRRIRFTKNPENSPAKPGSLSKKKNNFNHNFRTLSNVLEYLEENKRPQVNAPEGKAEPPVLEGNKLRSCGWRGSVHKPKSFSQKFNNFFSFFSKKTPSKQYYEILNPDLLRRFTKPNNRDFDGSGLRRLPVTDERIRENVENSDIQNFLKKGKSFDFLRMGGFDLRSKKAFEDRNLALKDLLHDKQIKEYRRRKKFLKRKRTAAIRNFELNETLKSRRRGQRGWRGRRIHKQKRSNRMWKKPRSKDANSKSGKEPVGTCGGTETRNYLNNLFRDTHPKIFNPKPTQMTKPQELKLKYERPIIKEGVLVIDQDLPENQRMEILLQEDELERKLDKYTNLPQPEPNERLPITGQDVFNLLLKLQNRSSRETRRNASSDEKKAKTPETKGQSEPSSGTTTQTTGTTNIKTTPTTKAAPAATPVATTTTTTTTSATAKTTVKAKVATKNPESTSQTSGSSSDATQTTPKTINTTVKAENDSKTEVSTLETTEASSSDYSDGCDYSFREVVLDPEEINDKEKDEKKLDDKKEETTESFGNEFFYLG